MNDRDLETTLGLLRAIERQSDVTQRDLARQAGVALGLANSYLKRLARKGLVKIAQVPPNRYLYYLTPKGFAEKSRLTAEYLQVSLSFYRRASASCARTLEACRLAGCTRIGLFGASDLAEIAATKAIDAGVTIVAVCDPDTTRGRFMGMPVVRRTAECQDVDGWLFVALEQAQLAGLLHAEGARRVFVPSILELDARGNDRPAPPGHGGLCDDHATGRKLSRSNGTHS